MRILVLSLYILASTASQCSTIDKLQTTEEVVEFIHSNTNDFKADNLELSIKSTDQLAQELACNGIFKEWDIKNWEKADLNNDGKTDLLVLGEWYGAHPLIVLDKGQDTYEFIRLSNNSFEYCELFKPISVKNTTLIKAYVPINSQETLIPGAEKFRIDTLSFFNNTLVKYNPSPKTEAISSIHLKTSACYGNCPEFVLELFPDDRVEFNGLENTPVLGMHSYKATSGTFKEISELLNYMDVKHLKSGYQVNWTDDQTAYLTIRFADGSTKTIMDYGLQGTPGLKAVYKALFTVMKNVNTM
ncbi:DUF6438 domain-containing protein [Winogradskyella aurantiaca]|uniref:DUF6438 domain-containing protein n=1 Tax=Winogradskyella aurantiaca TaxID=2219558 RepID=UPI0013009C42|nr:DUF6438 domain-containing protein [Winogradskyella aurantiaca]